MTRRIAIAVVALAAIIAAILVFSRTSTTPASTEHGSDRRGSAEHDVKAAVDRLRWFGQRGVNDRRIAGVVLHDGTPVAGATVRLASQLSMAGVARDVERVTDPQGRFDFGPQLATAYVITADKPKLTGALQRLDLRFPTFPVDDLHLVLHACDASLHGVVRDTAGGVIARARVAVTDREIETRAGVDTDDKGVYELCVPVGDSRVSIIADGYARELEEVSAYGPLRRDFALSPEASIAGRVLRADDRTPVANAIVELVPDVAEETDTEPRSAKLYAVSDDTGRFRFEGATPGQHGLHAKADGLASKPVYVIADVDGGEEAICLLETTFSVSGRVVSRGTTTGVGDIAVDLSPTSTASRPSSLFGASQADGTFVVEHLFPDEYRPALRRNSLANKPPNIVVAKADVTGVVLEVESAGTIAGRVTHDGKGVDGTRVTATAWRSGSAVTDHAGNFVIRDLPSASYQLYAESERAGAFANGPMISLARGEHRVGVDIDMNLSSSIAGVVVDQNGEPAGGVTIDFSLLGGRDFGVATTAEDGTFKSTGLSGGGDYAYEVSADARSSIVFPPVGRKRHPPIAVAGGNTQVTGVRIKIRIDPQQSVAGHVVSATGKPIADALVSVEPETSVRQRVRTDEAGAFRITGIASDTTTVSVIGVAGARTGNLERIAVGRTDLELRLSDPGAIEGTLEGFTGTPEVTARSTGDYDVARRYRATASGATFRISNVPHGVYSVVVRSASSIAGVGKVEVEAGETVKLALRPRGVGRLEGSVTRKGPIKNLLCTATDSLGRVRGATTDRSGVFRVEGLVEGTTDVNCDSTSQQVTIVANETTRVSLELDAPMTERDVGFEVTEQLSDVRVSRVTPRGAAERAGMKVGDIITKIDGSAVSSADDAELGWNAPGSTVKITVDRDEMQLVLELVVPAD